ncbi:hypothetical protein Bbelb_310330 [Branchiostoma belcheri]|nr:hypothetical protein Bbelb_310330 [Branchiostoma belcheri]
MTAGSSESGEVRKRVARIFREARARVDRIQRPSTKDEIRPRLVGCTPEYRSTLGRTGASYVRATREHGNELCDLKNRRRLVADVKNTFRVSASFGRLEKIAGDPENSRDARRNIGRTTATSDAAGSGNDASYVVRTVLPPTLNFAGKGRFPRIRNMEGIRADVEGICADTQACTYGPPYECANPCANIRLPKPGRGYPEPCLSRGALCLNGHRTGHSSTAKLASFPLNINVPCSAEGTSTIGVQCRRLQHRKLGIGKPNPVFKRVVNRLRALASEYRVEFSTGKPVPTQDSALEFQFWRSFSTGKCRSALESCAEFPSAQGPECRRHFPREFSTGWLERNPLLRVVYLFKRAPNELEYVPTSMRYTGTLLNTSSCPIGTPANGLKCHTLKSVHSTAEMYEQAGLSPLPNSGYPSIRCQTD